MLRKYLIDITINKIIDITEINSKRIIELTRELKKLKEDNKKLKEKLNI